jgi:ligand-binding sensor domain-containing protein
MKYNYLSLTFFLILLFGCKEDPVVEDPESLPDNYINAIFVTSDGTKYFATKNGLASFDGLNWTVFHSNPKIDTKTILDIGFEQTTHGPELWLATNNGINVASLPIDAVSGATTYTESNTKTLFPDGPGLAGDSVFVVKIDEKNIRWFGTNGGLSAFSGNIWPEINPGSHYNAAFFVNNRITSFDYSGDTLYIATRGGGVARMVSSSVDAVTAASPYEIPWSALPSDNVLSVFIDGSVQWYGTDGGLAKHTGIQAKTNWESYYEEDGLINNTVQCIQKDKEGNMWFGTPSGVSKFDGSSWESFTKQDGLVAGNVLCIAVDLDGSLWFGTDDGITNFDGTTWTSYKAE